MKKQNIKIYKAGIIGLLFTWILSLLTIKNNNYTNIIILCFCVSLGLLFLSLILSFLKTWKIYSLKSKKEVQQ